MSVKEVTTIRVSSETANRLWNIKMNDRRKSMDEIINMVLDRYEQGAAK